MKIALFIMFVACMIMSIFSAANSQIDYATYWIGIAIINLIGFTNIDR